MPQAKWKALIKACSGKIDSLIELLQGKFSKAIMSILIAKESELFPSSKEISMCCSCPDHAGMCKHIAAVLYGIGAAIDTQPEWLFSLRHVDHLELIASATTGEILKTSKSGSAVLEESDLSAIFDIDMAEPAPIKASTVATLKKMKRKKVKAKVRK